MTYYRLYFMHPYSGHILRFAKFHAADDEAATDLASEHIGESALELWSGHRKVIHIAPVFLEPSAMPATGGR